MLLKDKHGNWCNLEYKFAVEQTFMNIRFIDGESGGISSYWWRVGKYKTQRAMLQALEQFRINNNRHLLHSYEHSKESGFYTVMLFRPVHLNYDL